MKVVSPLRTRGGVNCQEGDKDRTAETDASLTSLEGVDAVFVLAGQNHHRPPPSAARHLLCQTLSYRTGSVLRRPSRTCSPVLSSWVGGEKEEQRETVLSAAASLPAADRVEKLLREVDRLYHRVRGAGLKVTVLFHSR